MIKNNETPDLREIVQIYIQMQKDRLTKLLKILGFTYISFVDNAQDVSVVAGHGDEASLPVLQWNAQNGDISGPYSGLLNKLDRALNEYIDGADYISNLSPEMRQEWVSKIERKYGLPPNFFEQLSRKGVYK